MSAFVRTPSGLANYHKFYGVDFTVYIEGKTADEQSEPEAKPVDVHYYESVLKAARANKTFKVKIVGNKEAALAYARVIREGGVANSAVIVDKDLEGITSSSLPLTPVIRTFGYSWENEFWSANTVAAVLGDLTNADERAVIDLEERMRSLARRLGYLSALDAASQVTGVAILSKRSALCGVAFSFPGVSAREVARIAKKYKTSAAYSCPIAAQVARGTKNIDPRQVIQGHFWSNFVLRFIAGVYKAVTGDTGPSNTMLTNLALANLRRNPSSAVGTDLVARYGLELARFGI